MKGIKLRTAVALVLSGVSVLAAGLVTAQSEKTPTAATLERGKFLVEFGGCTDCHTPMVMTQNGPRYDSTRYLSGHPSALKMPPAPKLEMPWMAAASATLTAWSGPWGISYSANLTPDSSGMGVWTEDMFLQAMRSGKHWGVSRPIMPPMPWETIGKLSDADLKAVYAFLQTIPSINNVVPDYEPPAEMPGGQK